MRLEDPAKYQSIVDAEWNIIYDKLAKCRASGAKVVLSRLAIGDLATQYFADHDIFCAGRVRGCAPMLCVCCEASPLEHLLGAWNSDLSFYMKIGPSLHRESQAHEPQLAHSSGVICVLPRTPTLTTLAPR